MASEQRDRELLAAHAGMKRAPFILDDPRLDNVTEVSVAQALRAISQAREEGRGEERATVVAWLDSLGVISPSGEYLARRIVAGDHLPPPGERVKSGEDDG